MRNKNIHRITIGLFLIIGTLLALWLTIYEGNSLFRTHTTWLYRDGFMQKVAVAAIYADIALLFIAGLPSSISFFRKGYVWKPITKVIIINIILWLTYAAQSVSFISFVHLAMISLILATPKGGVLKPIGRVFEEYPWQILTDSSGSFHEIIKYYQF